jgi:hypothetical protein
MNDVRLPFDAFPQGGRVPLGRPKSGNGSARTGYGLALQHLTGQTECAFCGFNLITSFENWLMLSVDHVVPRAGALKLGIPDCLFEDAFNLVLACSACNGFDNRFVCAVGPVETWTVEEFCNLRDATFPLRFDRIKARREKERALYEARPWVISADN